MPPWQSTRIFRPMNPGDPDISLLAPDELSIDLSVIIVNYNVREFLEQALRSVEDAGKRVSMEVFVVDNNSVDGSVEMIRSQFPSTRIIANQTNIGFGKANNQAIRQASGRYLLILNPDTIVQEDTLSSLVAFMDAHPDAGAAGCQILNPDGSFAPESRRSFPTPDVAFFRVTGLSRLFPRSPRFGRYNMTFLPRNEISEVDALSGSCMMLRAEALRMPLDGTEGEGAGLFDEQFFMYGEDLDLCYRIQKAGWKIFYTPDTQIIHYKGESTKKGELRYVRLFYGAMLLFIEKHLDSSPSGLLTGLLRLGIMVRAGISVSSNALKRAAFPLTDLLVVYATVTVLGLARALLAGTGLVLLFFLSVSLAYAVGTVVGIGLAGGYRRSAELPLRSVFTGTSAGFLMVATASFFIPHIAFSRLVVALSLPVSAILLALWRVIKRSRHHGLYRAVLVGKPDEARRLAGMLEAHPQPPFLLEGYVSDREETDSIRDDGPPRLGEMHHLRDLIRLRHLHDVVFAASSLTNQTIFKTMIELQNLGVQFRMLHAGSDLVIGKASVNHLSIGSLTAHLPEVVVLRSRAARRTFEISASISGLLLLPLATLMLPFAGRASLVSRLVKVMKQLPGVLTGRLSLVGCRIHDQMMLPKAWKLKPGVFSIMNTLRTQELDEGDLTRAYWYYVTHQSSGLDIDIIVRCLRDERNNG